MNYVHSIPLIYMSRDSTSERLTRPDLAEAMVGPGDHSYSKFS
jgi:hypothetical protein